MVVVGGMSWLSSCPVTGFEVLVVFLDSGFIISDFTTLPPPPPPPPTTTTTTMMMIMIIIIITIIIIIIIIYFNFI